MKPGLPGVARESYRLRADTTYNKGQAKWERFDRFSAELEPIVEQLNELLNKYQIYPIENFISFPVSKGKITPFINYQAFPSSIISLPPVK